MKTRPTPYVLPSRIWSFCVRGCMHKYMKTPKIESARTQLSSDGRRGWPQDSRTSFTRYLADRGRSALKGVVVDREPQIGERYGPTPLRFRHGWPKTRPLIPLRMCYHVKFDTAASKGVFINRMERQNIGQRWGPVPWCGRGWPLKTSLLPTCVTMSNLVVLRQKGVCMNTPESKNRTPYSCS